MTKLLTRLRIDEISAVDRGAGEGVRIMLMKRADPADGFEAWHREQAAIAERQNAEHLAAHGYDADEHDKYREERRKHFLAIFSKRRVTKDDDDDDGDLSRHSEVIAPDKGSKDFADVADDFKGGGDSHLAEEVADMLVKTGGYDGEVFSNRLTALHWLLHSPRGVALLRHMSLHKGDSSMTNSEPRAETIAKLCKAHGVIAIAKSIIEDGESPLSEHELTALATEHAKALHPTLTKEQAFAKFIETPRRHRSSQSG